MIKTTIFTTTAGVYVKIFQSLDQAQDYINATPGVSSFRVFQINGKKQKKELNNGTR